MNISISEKANKNYLAKIVKIKTIKKHPNADRLQIAIIDFQEVITGVDAKAGDLYVYFPLECKINKDYLSSTNSFRHANLNQNPEEPVGFFDDNGRVKAVKLRGEKSYGYLVPISSIEKFFNIPNELSKYEGMEFDTINDVLLVERYISPANIKGFSDVYGKKRESRLIDGQVNLHVDTENLARNIEKISPEDEISISYKLHGTSARLHNVIVKKKLSRFQRLLKWLKIPIQETEYDIVYGSRNVNKNAFVEQVNNDWYGEDVWAEMKEKLKDSVPKGITIYSEIVGYTKGGKAIQNKYDYGCEEKTNEIYIYRITFTNPDGISFELSTNQIKAFCERIGAKNVPVFYEGKAKDLFNIPINENWHTNFLEKLKEKYIEKKCFMCKNSVPEEGIVLRKESIFKFEVYKLKSWKFLEDESKALDSGSEDIELTN